MTAHLMGLRFRDTRFKRTKMFVFNPIRFSKNLPPTILAGGFDPKHDE